MPMDELNDLPPLEKARALFERGRTARREGRDEFAHGFYTQSLNLCRGHRDRQGEAAALVELADLALHYNPTGQDPFSLRKALAEKALALYRDLGDKRGAARALRVLASIAPKDEGLRLLEESLSLVREEEDRRGIAASLDRLGAYYAMREPEKARALKEEALALWREIGDRDGEATTLFSLSISYMGTDPARGRQCAEEALAIYRELGRKKGVAQMLMFLASYQLDEERQIAYHTECRELCREIGVPIWEASSLRGLAKIAEKRGELERAQALRAEGDQIYPEPPEDPKLLKAFQQALGKKDPDAATGALRKLFGKGGRRRTTQ
jgi:tetratricopeptide (TPR) repeat protein